MDPPIEHNPRTDTVTDLDHKKILGFVSAKGVFGQRRRSTVVHHVNRQRVPLGEKVTKRYVVPVEVGGLNDGAAVVDYARGANTYPEGRGWRCCKQFIDHVKQLVDAILPLERLLGSFGAVSRARFQIEHRTDTFTIAEIDGDDASRFGVESEERRWLASRRRTGTEFVDEAIILELSDQVRDCGRGKSGTASNVGATDRAPGNDALEDEAKVLAALVVTGGFALNPESCGDLRSPFLVTMFTKHTKSSS